MPANWTTGYFAQGSFAPDKYPETIYGTEVFEVNEALRDMAAAFAESALPFNDSSDAMIYRANYAPSAVNDNFTQYPAGAHSPSVIKCDTATADVFFSGVMLGNALENTTSLFTNGSGVYCMTAQENNATLRPCSVELLMALFISPA
jgi:purine nucleoside permease